MRVTSKTICFDRSSTWTVSAESETNCTIIGDRIDPLEAGEWNCELGSFPLENANNEYDHIQKYFQLKLMTPAVINDRQWPAETQLMDGQTAHFDIGNVQLFVNLIFILYAIWRL